MQNTVTKRALRCGGFTYAGTVAWGIAIEAARQILEPKDSQIVDAKLDPARVFDGKGGREVVATWLVTYQMPGGSKTIVFIDATTGLSRGVMQVN